MQKVVFIWKVFCLIVAVVMKIKTRLFQSVRKKHDLSPEFCAYNDITKGIEKS